LPNKEGVLEVESSTKGGGPGWGINGLGGKGYDGTRSWGKYRDQGGTAERPKKKKKKKNKKKKKSGTRKALEGGTRQNPRKVAPGIEKEEGFSSPGMGRGRGPEILQGKRGSWTAKGVALKGVETKSVRRCQGRSTGRRGQKSCRAKRKCLKTNQRRRAVLPCKKEAV